VADVDMLVPVVVAAGVRSSARSALWRARRAEAGSGSCVAGNGRGGSGTGTSSSGRGEGVVSRGEEEVDIGSA
jgi:hypothetical protein